MIDLTKPLSWMAASTDEKIMLEDLQGNILKGHGRNHTQNIFLHFEDANAAKDFIIKYLAPQITSAHTQLQETKIFKETDGKTPGKTFIGLFLSSLGYRALGIVDNKIPQNEPFKEGLKNRQSQLSDPSKDKWDKTFQNDIHAMILIGDDDPRKVEQTYAGIQKYLPATVKVLGIEKGIAMRNANGDGIEHFGYVDGRSQPLLLQEDIKSEQENTDGISVWDPKFPLKQVLVPCPGGASDKSFGSYFVFRKLEQNVKGFKEKEEEIAKELKLEENGEDPELAGAMIVGRFEDGTPVVLQKSDGMHNPVPNNFDYRDDVPAMKCPFHSHIRKTNPRGDSVRELGEQFGVTLEQERSHIMARRGITYGDRLEVDGRGQVAEFDPKIYPSCGVGLLFMAYQSDLANQFEFTQQTWANNPNFVKADPKTGIDPVIGQGSDASIPQLQCPVWGKPGKQPISFSGFVKMLGGEYFFAPSISCLKNL